MVKDFANTRDPTMFAAAGDAAGVGRVELSTKRLGRTKSFVFLEPPPEEIEEHGDCVWRSVRVIHGRHKGARLWQEHFDANLRSEEARQRGFTVVRRRPD